jgi:hypothetical protein
MAGKGRAGQNCVRLKGDGREGQGRTEMCKTEKGMAGKGRAGQRCERLKRGWQRRAGPDRAVQGREGQGRTEM